MFYRFADEKHYPKHEWAAVWLFETFVFGILMEDLEELKKMNIFDLYKGMDQRLAELLSSIKQDDIVKILANTRRKLLSDQINHIYDFISKVPNSLERLDHELGLVVEFPKYAKESSDFASFLQRVSLLLERQIN